MKAYSLALMIWKDKNSGTEIEGSHLPEFEQVINLFQGTGMNLKLL